MISATFWPQVSLSAEVILVLQLPPKSKKRERTCLPLQSGFFQVIEVWHPWTSSPGEPDAILPSFAGHLVRVGSRGMPSGLYLPWQRVVVWLSALGVGSDAAHWDGPCFRHAQRCCFGWRVGKWLEAYIRWAIWSRRRRRRRRLANSCRGRRRRGEVQELTQRPKRLVLKVNKNRGN